MALMETIYSCQQDHVKTFGNTHRGRRTKQGVKKTKQRTNATVIFNPIHFIHLKCHLSVQISIKPNFYDKLGVLFHRSNIRLLCEPIWRREVTQLHPYISVHLRGPMKAPEPNRHLRGTW